MVTDLICINFCFVTCKFFTFKSFPLNHFVVWNIEKPSNIWISKIKNQTLPPAGDIHSDVPGIFFFLYKAKKICRSFCM